MVAIATALIATGVSAACSYCIKNAAGIANFFIAIGDESLQPAKLRSRYIRAIIAYKRDPDRWIAENIQYG